MIRSSGIQGFRDSGIQAVVTRRESNCAVMAAMTGDLGKLKRKLDEFGIEENTIVIYTSDNVGRTRILNGGKGDLGEGDTCACP
ncbi:MAG TPA: hypothetical protein PK648_18615 [Verrucomicrobiales bacterium]|nr:hypothetical protein [Verrucomicrobiales bacterium]